MIKPSARRVEIKRKKYTPVWEGTFESWSKGWVNKNFWRVKHQHCSKEDSLQECALIFSRLARQYDGQLDNPAWFMALYKTSVARDWITFAQKESQKRDVDFATTCEQIDYNLGPLMLHLRICRDEIRQVMSVLAGAPMEVITALTTGPDQASRNRKTKRLLGASDELICQIAQGYATLRRTSCEDALICLDELAEVLG